MIDHLIRFEGEIDLAAFQITLPEDGEIGATAIGAMVGEQPVTILPVSIINQEAKYDLQTGQLITPAVIATGTWIVVRAQGEFANWRTNSRLVAITDDERVNIGQPFVRYKNDDYPWDVMQGRVSPTFAGSHYPFGPHMNESQLIA